LTTSFQEWRITRGASVAENQPVDWKLVKRCAEAIRNTMPTGVKVLQSKTPLSPSAFRAEPKGNHHL
jgi:hypothetical protein